jgi:hypothetical protein
MAGENESGSTVAEKDEDAIPQRRVIWLLIGFGAWTTGNALLHAFWPLKFDVTAVVVLQIAISPLLLLLFNVELGYGDWKVKFLRGRIQERRVVRAFAAVDTLVEKPAEEAPTAMQANEAARGIWRFGRPPEEEPEPVLEDVPDDVVFIRLRREILKRLQRLADAYNVTNMYLPPIRALPELQERGIIGEREARGLTALVVAGKAQAQGQTVKPETAELARTEGAQLLAALDRIALMPEREVIYDVAERADQADKEVAVEKSLFVNGRHIRPDLIVPNELVIEVKATSDRPTLIVDAARQAQQYSTLIGDVKPLLVLVNRPVWVHDDMPETFTGVGVAWKDGHGFGGDQVAREIAPWLFDARCDTPSQT